MNDSGNNAGVNPQILSMIKDQQEHIRKREELLIADFNDAAEMATGAKITGVRGIDSAYLVIECEDGELSVCRDTFDGYVIEWSDKCT